MKKPKKLVSHLRYEDSKRDSKFIFNITVIAEVIEALKRLKKCHDFQEVFQQAPLSNLQAMVQQYLTITSPFDEDKRVFSRINGMGKEFWHTPSKLLIKKLYRLYESFAAADPQLASAGNKNIWIIKPSSNSR